MFFVFNFCKFLLNFFLNVFFYYKIIYINLEFLLFSLFFIFKYYYIRSNNNKQMLFCNCIVETYYKPFDRITHSIYSQYILCVLLYIYHTSIIEYGAYVYSIKVCTFCVYFCIFQYILFVLGYVENVNNNIKTILYE